MRARAAPSRKRKEIVSRSPLVEITLLHRAMRFELESMCQLASGLAGMGQYAEGLHALERRYRDFDAVFSSHSSAEDDFIFPALARKGCSLAAEAADEHIEEANAMQACEAAVVEASARGVTRETVAVLVSLKERLCEHMMREEDQIFPALARFDDCELGVLVGLVIGSRPADVLAKTIRMEVNHLAPEHARHVLATMCDVAKRTKFREWLDHELGSTQRVPPPPLLGANPPPPPPATPPKPMAPCPHYGHTTRVRAPCCGATVCCRKCHDAAGCGKAMESAKVAQMLCGACGVWGPVGGVCGGCGTKAAAYHCGVCKLFDSSMIPTYHCPFCNVCRRGHGLGIDFHHCMKCNMCVSLANLDTHVCAGAAGRGGGASPSCSLSGESLFHSTDTIACLPCGHPALASAIAAAVSAIPPPSCRLCAAEGRTKGLSFFSKRQKGM